MIGQKALNFLSVSALSAYPSHNICPTVLIGEDHSILSLKGWSFDFWHVDFP
jgi:hypothetical protein